MIMENWKRIAVAVVIGAGITVSALHRMITRRRQSRVSPVSGDVMRVVFVGTGTSEGIPRLTCLMSNNNTQGKLACRTCHDAMHNPHSKNSRKNTSLLLQFNDCNVLIDCGKFFWYAALKTFPAHGVRNLNAIVLTHSHCDAAYGLDDLRDLTLSHRAHEGKEPLIQPINIYMRAKDRPVLANAFPYLFKGNSGGIVGGGVAALNFHDLVDDVTPFQPVPGLDFEPLSVVHGPDGCLGYRIGKDKIVYISDIVSMPENTFEQIKAGGPFEILILDALRFKPEHGTHYTVDQACDLILQIRNHFSNEYPKNVWLVGMTHDVEHDAGNKYLAQIKNMPFVQLAYDGHWFDI